LNLCGEEFLIIKSLVLFVKIHLNWNLKDSRCEVLGVWLFLFEDGVASFCVFAVEEFTVLLGLDKVLLLFFFIFLGVLLRLLGGGTTFGRIR
jgi:hypothetical protein